MSELETPETRTEKLRNALKRFRGWFRRSSPEMVPVIPSVNNSKLVVREQNYYSLILLGFCALLFIFPTYVHPMILPLVGSLTAADLITWMGLILSAVLIYEGKSSYDKKNSEKATAYDRWEGDMREKTEEGMQSYSYFLCIEKRQLLSASLEDIRPEDYLDDEGEPCFTLDDLKDDSGEFIIGGEDRAYLITAAYRDDDDILKRFIVICKGSLSEHEQLTVDSRVYLGLFGTNCKVAKMNFVVVRRMMNGSPILYLTDSSQIVSTVLGGGEHKQYLPLEALRAEAESNLTAVNRLLNHILNTEAKLEAANKNAIYWERMYHEKIGKRKTRSGIMKPQREPEEEKDPAFTPRQKRWITLIFLCAVLGIWGFFNAGSILGLLGYL